MEKSLKEEDGLIKCSVCEEYFKKNEGFYCPKCNKGPSCKKHRSPGKKECISCSIENKLHEISALSRQEKSIHHFIRFIQFIFLVVSVFFIALKLGILNEIDFLKNNIFMENLIYIGVGTAIFYAISYIVLLSQKDKIAGLHSEIENKGFRKF